jgi:hypothetical protein
MVKKEQRATKPRMKVGSKVQYSGPISVPLFHHFPKGVSELLIPNGLCMVFGKVWTYTHAWAVIGNPATPNQGTRAVLKVHQPWFSQKKNSNTQF